MEEETVGGSLALFSSVITMELPTGLELGVGPIGVFSRWTPVVEAVAESSSSEVTFSS
ncbi:hypothetical protein CTI12_AA589360 [Artemisia annua]|uniref:Uncharacterized protein n=1 Tax=Artemisia annua TaxID=35608 RepID=A0A2U1KL98_ARTAN|nr:hypothetical protein CTI12_AA589360 [Artemisia annua]